MNAGLLDALLGAVREDLACRMSRLPLGAVMDLAARRSKDRRNFREALRAGPPGWVSVIAEIKRASPSRGLLMDGRYSPVELARLYEENGARAISVVTERRYFRGDPDQLPAVREVVRLPVLRKDFILHKYQVYETVALGADALLLIAAVLEPARLEELHALARGMGLDVLVEVHHEAELEAALRAGADLIGINNRDLRTFRTDLTVTERLAPLCPPGVTVVSESGVRGPDDLERLVRVGVHAVLVGEALVTAREPVSVLRGLVTPRPQSGAGSPVACGGGHPGAAAGPPGGCGGPRRTSRGVTWGVRAGGRAGEDMRPHPS
ncbi:MAG: indole-3-glycerol phosphate synthase TrpC [Firmicutes bacterium]|nr:indole-3-glycerol phosphate synthase TrpC [Bacillota bacterium]